jgi:hypothetical protein
MTIRRLTPQELAEQKGKERLERQQNRRMDRKNTARRTGRTVFWIAVFAAIYYILWHLGVT